MGEFSGIEPAGANALLKALNGEAAQLPHLVSAVRSGAYEAGSDLDGAASGADQALQRYQRFLDFWTRDLKWRIQYIQIMTNSSPFDKVQRSADLPYRNYQEAQRDGSAAGKAEGERLKQLWAQYQQSHNAQDLQQFTAELAKSGAYRGEPYYSGALLKALGKDTFREILARRISPVPGMADQQGNSKAGLQALRQELGPLADMFAAADRGGTLPSEVRQEALGLQSHLLATFLRLSDNHTDQFALDAAKQILDQPAVSGGNAGAFDDRVAARRILLDELWRRPGVTQMLLQDPKYTHALYFPDAVKAGKLNQYQEELAAVLWKTLGQDVGDRQSQLRAWTNLIKVGSGTDIREMMALLPNRSSAEHPNLAAVLAIRFKPYLPWLSYFQGQAGHQGDDSKYAPKFGDYQPKAAGIPGVTLENARDFFAGLISSKTGRDTVVDVANDWVNHNPALSDKTLRSLTKSGDLSADTANDINGDMLNQDGFLALLLRSGKVAKLDHDARVDFSSKVIGIGAGYTPVISNPFAGPLTEKPIKWIAEQLASGKDVDAEKVEAAFNDLSLKSAEKQLDGLNVSQETKEAVYAQIRNAYYANLLKPLFNDTAK